MRAGVLAGGVVIFVICFLIWSGIQSSCSQYGGGVRAIGEAISSQFYFQCQIMPFFFFIGMLAGIGMIIGGAVASSKKKKATYIPPQPQVAAGKEPQGNAIDALKKLADLKTQGILTEEEFQRKKEELLKKI